MLVNRKYRPMVYIIVYIGFIRQIMVLEFRNKLVQRYVTIKKLSSLDVSDLNRKVTSLAD